MWGRFKYCINFYTFIGTVQDYNRIHFLSNSKNCRLTVAESSTIVYSPGSVNRKQTKCLKTVSGGRNRWSLIAFWAQMSSIFHHHCRPHLTHSYRHFIDTTIVFVWKSVQCDSIRWLSSLMIRATLYSRLRSCTPCPGTALCMRSTPRTPPSCPQTPPARRRTGTSCAGKKTGSVIGQRVWDVRKEREREEERERLIYQKWVSHPLYPNTFSIANLKCMWHIYQSVWQPMSQPLIIIKVVNIFNFRFALKWKRVFGKVCTIYQRGQLNRHRKMARHPTVC